MSSKSFEDNSVITTALMKDSFRRTLPWVVVVVFIAVNALVAWGLIPPKLVSYRSFIIAAAFLCAAPFMCQLVRTFCKPLKKRLAEETGKSVSLLRLKLLKWWQLVLMVSICWGSAVLSAKLLGYPEQFVAVLQTSFLTVCIVLSLMLRVSPGETETKESGRLRRTIGFTKTFTIFTGLVALAGYVNLGWRLFWLLVALAVWGFLAAVLKALVGNLLLKITSLEYNRKESSNYSRIQFRKRMVRTAGLINFFFRNLWFITGVYLIIFVAGIPLGIALDILHFTLFSIGAMSFSLIGIFKAYLVILTVLISGRVVKDFLLFFVFPKAGLDRGTSQVLSNVLFILIIASGIVTSLSMLGVNILAIGLIGGGLAVGIGFGLQNITNNIISGIILFFERPINVGDVIDVNGHLGTVQQIGIRGTVVTTFNNITVIIPNSEFISGTVVNWSWGDITMRIDIPVGVAYGTDVEKVKTILIDIAQEHDMILSNPPADVLFEEFADSSLNFVLRAWISDLRKRREVLSDINFRIDEEFRKIDIEIPFPQRDVHIRSTSDSE